MNKLITETHTVFYAHTYRLCQFLIKNIPVINWGCTCVKTFAEDNFLREGWGCVNLMIFICEFLCFGLTEKALFQVILGLLLVYADWEKGGVSVTVCLRVCMCVCFTTYNYWDMFFAVRLNDSFNFPLGWIKYTVIIVIYKRLQFNRSHNFVCLCSPFLVTLCADTEVIKAKQEGVISLARSRHTNETHTKTTETHVACRNVCNATDHTIFVLYEFLAVCTDTKVSEQKKRREWWVEAVCRLMVWMSCGTFSLWELTCMHCVCIWCCEHARFCMEVLMRHNI